MVKKLKLNSQPSASDRPFARLARFFSYLSISNKITFGYALVLGIAVSGTTVGFIVGNYYRHDASQRLEDARGESELTSSLEVAILEARSQQLELFPLLRQPEELQEEKAKLIQQLTNIKECYSQLQSFALTAKTTKELKFLLQHYDSTTEEYYQQLEIFFQQIEPLTIKEKQNLPAAQKLLLSLINSPESIRVNLLARELKVILQEAAQKELAANIALEHAEKLRNLIVAFSMLMSILIATILAVYTSRAISQPLERVTQVAQQVTQESNFQLKSPVTTQDEVGVLATSLNALIERVADYIQEIELARQTLEKRVEERTQELSAALEELQQTQTHLIQAAVEREQAEQILLQTKAQEALLRANVAERAKLELEQEITERKRTELALRSSYATNRALLDAIPDLILRIDKDGTFVNFKAAKDRNTLPAREIVGKRVNQLFPHEVAHSIMVCVETALSTNESQVIEYQLPIDNHLRDYEARIVVSAEDEVMALVRDITQRKQEEQDIRTALEKEKELSELKSRFVSMASHEFRTPLTTILSSTELLEKYSYNWAEEKKLKHFQRIQQTVKHMTTLLNDVLLVGKAEAGKLEFNPTQLDVVQFCRELVEDIQFTTDTHTIAFCCHTPSINAYMDEKLLRHILSNLLSNAIKYSPGGCTVNFDLNCQCEEVIFQVQDRGIGIPDFEQAQLFTPFHRASNVGTIAGTGLGLAIMKKSVDLHGGRITVESKVGSGTTFIVVISLKHQVSAMKVSQN